MALAFSLLFDGETDRAVRQVWQKLADAGVCRSMLDLDYAPHLSLIVTDDETLEGRLNEAVAGLRGAGAFTLRLGPPRHFPETTISWLACEETGQLMALQGQIAGFLPLDAIRQHYRPGQWTPHNTLQMTGDVSAGLALAGQMLPETIVARIDAIEVARFMPVASLKRVDLAY